MTKISTYSIALLLGLLLNIDSLRAEVTDSFLPTYQDTMATAPQPSAFDTHLNAGTSKRFQSLTDEEVTAWSFGGMIYVRVNESSNVQIYTITGQLKMQLRITEGETVIPVSRGLYIIRIGNVTRKVIVR